MLNLKYIVDSVGIDPANALNVKATVRFLNDDGTPFIDVRTGKPLTMDYKSRDLDQAVLHAQVEHDIAELEKRASFIAQRDAALADLQQILKTEISASSKPDDPDEQAKAEFKLLRAKVAGLFLAAKPDDPDRIAAEAELNAVYKAHPDWLLTT